MARNRKESLLELLVDFPWWVSVVFAAVVYVVIKWMFPWLAGGNLILSGLAAGFQGLAGLFAFLFLLPGAASFYRQVIRGRNLEAQRNLDTLRRLSWREFEGLTGEAFRRRGYLLIEQGGNKPDGGIDLVLRKDGQKVLVQCKHWQARQVGVSVIREQFGILAAEGADKVYVVTSGSFTNDAKAFANGKPIALIDGPALLELVSGVQKTGVASSAAEITDQSPTCPRCGGIMKRRVAKQGANAGEPFWGCVRFPQCRGTRAI